MTRTESESQSERERTDSTKRDGAGGESTVGRRELLAASGSLSAAALAGCVGSGPSSGGGGSGNGGDSTTGSGGGTNESSSGGEYPDYSGQSINVATWAGIYAEAFEKTVAKSFEERTGATVEVVPAGGSILSKIKSAPKDDPPFDLAAAEGFFYWQGRNEDLFLETRNENIPNLEGVYPYLKEFRGTKYGVPTDGSLNGILYRTDLGWEPTEWMDLLADKPGTDRIGFEGAWYIYPFEVAAVSLDQVEGIGELYQQQYHGAVFDRMRAFGENVELWTGSFAEIQSSLRQRIIDMSMWYSGMGNAAASQGDSLAFTTPENTAGYLDHYCPVRGTEKRRMAEDFLNHMLDAGVQTEWSSEGFVYVSNAEASYPKQVRDQYPRENDAWKRVSIADFTELAAYSSTFSEEFQAIQNQ